MADGLTHEDETGYHKRNPFPQRPTRHGLLPTDGYEAYKKSPIRSSRRSRAERTSYLVATGHLDLEETRHLNPSRGYSEYPANSPIIDQHNEVDDHTVTYRTDRSFRIAELTTDTPSRYLDTNETMLEDLNGGKSFRSSQTRGTRHDVMSKKSKSNLKGSKKYKDKLSPYEDQLLSRPGPTYLSETNDSDIGQNRSKFRQTYTEVSLPMKTSPAFEYILKDNRRRNKRCCMWLLYTTLVTICLTIMVFCGVHLILRYQNSSH